VHNTLSVRAARTYLNLEQIEVFAGRNKEIGIRIAIKQVNNSGTVEAGG
jgi:hypothetical protein